MIDNYNALPLGTFMQIDAVLETDADELDKQVRIVAILSGKPVDEVLNLPLPDYTSMAAETAFLREPCTPSEIPAGWKLDGLAPVADFTKITTAQYIDFQAFAKDFPRSLPALLSVFLVPEGKRYNEGYDVTEVQERVKAMPLPDAIGLSAFFFARCLNLIANSLDYLDDVAKKTKDPQRRAMLQAAMRQAQALLPGAGAGSAT